MRVRSPITILCAFANEAIGEILTPWPQVSSRRWLTCVRLYQ